jgi:hypothetical protein
MACYNCSKEPSSQTFFIPMNNVGPNKMEILIRGQFGKNENRLIIPGGLCKDCMAMVFEEAAKLLRQMPQNDFRQIV